MTRRYTRETPEQAAKESRYAYSTTILSDGTTYTGNVISRDMYDVRYLPERIARGEVTPVPVDINQEAATFKRAKKR